MKRINTLLLLMLFSCKMMAVVWHNVNIDKKTAAAMTAAYEVEIAMETMANGHLQNILNHYRSASVATAGILVSKKKDRDAMRNPGLFASEENYYYTRILDMVKNRIMPKFITVASLMVKQPENAIYWGPYLLKTTTNVEQLCKQFELVCTNGRLSFKDVQFLLINDKLQAVFDLARMGSEVNWKDLLDKLGDFGKELSADDLVEDFKNLGGKLASIGQNTADSNWAEISKIGEIFHSKPKEIYNMFKSFKSQYENYKNAGNVKNILMSVIKTADAEGVAKLFKIDDYNVSGYISNYVKELQGEYYTQRWYIYTVDSGKKEIASYCPSAPASTNNEDSWTGWIYKCNYMKTSTPPFPTLTTSEYNQLKTAAENSTDWNASRKKEYEKNNPGHTISLNYEQRSYNYVRDKSGGIGSHSKHWRGRHFSVYMTVTDSWYIKQEVYEEIFDSQTMDLKTFKEKMKIRLQGYQDETSDQDESITYHLECDDPHYYTMADEKKMEGCSSVSFVANCKGGAKLGEGSFNWKENGKQGNHLNEASKGFAKEPTPDSEGEGINTLLDKQKEYENQIASLKKQISDNDKRMRSLLQQKSQALFKGNKTQANALQKQYNELSDANAALKQQLNTTQNQLNQLNNGIDEYYKDLADNQDGKYRINDNMAELEGMYQIQWSDQGEWVDGNNQYIFIRHGYCPTVKSLVTYTAALSLAQKPKYLLGIRIHRAILSVDFKLTSEYAADNVVAVMQLDMKKSEKERAEEVNAKLKELIEDLPDCNISIKYNYAGSSEEEDDADAIHLLWACDRLDVAREIDFQLVSIYNQLVLLEKVMDSRTTILDFLKHKIFEAVGRASRGAIADYALSRWQDASAKAAQKATLRGSVSGDNETDKNNNSKSRQQ